MRTSLDLGNSVPEKSRKGSIGEGFGGRNGVVNLGRGRGDLVAVDVGGGGMKRKWVGRGLRG